MNGTFRLLSVFGFLGIGMLAVLSPLPSGPPEMRITPPAAALAPRLAGLSGAWEDTTGGQAVTRVVVERIDETRATILQYWPDGGAGHRRDGWEREIAHVLRDGTVRWGYPLRHTLRLTEDGALIETEGVGLPARMVLRKSGHGDLAGSGEGL